jgi:hypothetical protein
MRIVIPLMRILAITGHSEPRLIRAGVCAPKVAGFYEAFHALSYFNSGFRNRLILQTEKKSRAVQN